MRRPRLAVLIALPALLLAEGSAHAEPDKRVVAVLYFDNNTGRADLDVLKKGFADMMVTDLASVPGLQVVERDRLEELLGELKLQKSKYFDPQTALKIGRGLGARFAVTGAFAAFDPKMRIDLRMIEIATGKVVLADKVVGEKSKLFELQSELVEKFVQGLDAKAPARSKVRAVPDVETLLEYSKSVDLADRGKLEDATEAMKALVKKHPTFVLARAKQNELLRRLSEAKERRQQAITQTGMALERAASAYLETHPEIDRTNEQEAKTHLAYRHVLGAFLYKALDPHLASQPVRYVKPGHERDAYRLLQAIVANGEKLVEEADLYAGAFTKKLPNGQTYLDTSVQLPAEQHPEARKLNMDVGYSGSSIDVRRQLAEMILLGRVFDGKSYTLVGPVVASTDPAMEKRGYALLDEAYTRGKTALKDSPHLEYGVVSVLQSHAEALLLRDQTEAGIGKLQQILDDFPTGGQYERTEKRIQEELGMAYNHSRSTYAGFVAAYESCEDMEFRKGMGTMFHQRALLYGRQGILDVVEKVEKSCMDDEKLRKHFWPYLYMQAALYGGTRGDCDLFESMVKKYLAAGGSTGDLKGYRKNYAKTCN